MLTAPAVAGTVAAGGTPAAVSACAAGRLVNTPTVGTFDGLYGIAAVNPQDVWAVGRFIRNNADRALVEHFAGQRWQVVRIPQPHRNKVDLFAITAVSATDVWAVGGTENPRDEQPQTLIEHFDGTAWRIVPSPSAGRLDAVAAHGPNDVWAVGDSFNGQQSAKTLAEHWDGTSWQVVPTPSPGGFGDGLAGVSVTGPDNAWAVGDMGTSRFNNATLTEHWNGAAWSAVTSPAPGIDSELRAVTSAGGSDVWAVGDYDVNTPTGTAVLTLTVRWTGAAWSTVPSPSPTGDDDFGGVAAVSPSDIWAVGSGGGHDDLVARWNGHAWALLPTPHRDHALNFLGSVSAPSATDVWAAGGDIDLNGYSYHPLVEDVCPA
jgi:hypothetical protein